MTREEAIRILETDCHSPFPFTPGDLDEACRMGADALRAQQAPVRLDRSRWEGCGFCNKINPSYLKGVMYCGKCGRPINEESWSELEGRIGGSNGAAEIDV